MGAGKNKGHKPKPLGAAQLALIHVAKSKVGMADEEYRDLLGSFGVTSSKDLKRMDLDRIMAHFEKLGFTPRKPYQSSREKLKKKIKALLTVQDLPDSYADALSKRMFGRERTAWCTAEQLRKIVAALTYHQQRKARDG